MVKTLGVVHVGRHHFQTSLWRNLAERRLAGIPILDWVVRRVTEAEHIDRTVVVLGESPQDQRLSKLVPTDIDVFRARGNDALACVNAAVKQYAAESLIVVDLESPFVDPALIDRLVLDAHTNQLCDYASYCIHSDKDVLASRLGLVAEWCRADALDKADQHATSPIARSQVTPHIYTHPEEFTVRLIPVPKQLDCNDIRLAIHGEEDWEHADMILDALGPDELDWQRIAELLNQQPEIRKDMQRLNQASK